MPAEPPSSERPTGPPSGPLAGGTQDGSIPPPPPPPPQDGSGAAAPGPERGGGGPWWRSVPKVAALAAAVVVAVVLIVVLTRPGGGSARPELFLQAASSEGPHPFTPSTAREEGAGTATGAPRTEPQNSDRTQGISGSTAGLYGGTMNVAGCDVERQISYLAENPAKNRAFASVVGVQPGAVPDYLRALTPVLLRLDTRVTNHGYENGSATTYQAVLQAGTAVLINDLGVPRVRCACGNPLTDPEVQKGETRTTGDSWPAYNPARVVFVEPAPAPVKEFVLFDQSDKGWFARPVGHTGETDRPAPAPKEKAVVACPSPYPAGSTCLDTVPTPTPAKPPETTAPGTTEPGTTEPGTTAPPETPRTPETPATPENPGGTTPAPESPRTPEQPPSPESPAAPQTPEQPGYPPATEQPQGSPGGDTTAGPAPQSGPASAPVP
ncbi:DUF6777 domain-containing protein [Streptomyces sp. NPDC000594]|uniref:DUF6777 domain-containing protein n=1 Tax=Streptomyces sp. NPDC000594 TaxID=3154261 RepID=UPI003323A846